MTTVYYDDSHKKIVESGIPAIRRILFHNNTSEILSLLFCLDFYLDPYYKNTLSYEKEIYEWLRSHCNEEVTLNKMLAPEIEARYKLTNKILDTSNIKQVLESVFRKDFGKRSIVRTL